MKRLLFLPLLLAACVQPAGPNSETFVLPLDNVGIDQNSANVLEVAPSVGRTEALTIKVSVALGGCDAFETFRSGRSADRLELTPIGRRQLDVPCTAIYGTRWVEFSDAASPTRSSPFTVVVRRANGADLERTVTVTP
jgi:hypothetical protein